MKLSLFLLLAGLTAPFVCLPLSAADEPLAERPLPLAAGETNAGRMMPDVSLTDISGTPHHLRAMAAKQKALVIAFTSPTCPLSAKLLPTLAAVEKEFAAAGAAFVYVNPTASDSMEAIAAALTEGAKGAKETVVIISADASAKHQSVVTVMEAARRAGLNQITFATQSSAQAGEQ